MWEVIHCLPGVSPQPCLDPGLIATCIFAPDWNATLKHKILISIVCLQISAALYAVVGLVLCAILVLNEDNEYRLPIAAGSGVFCLMLIAGIQLIVFGLSRRKFWAWVAGLCVLGAYVPSMFLPLGLGSWSPSRLYAAAVG